MEVRSLLSVGTRFQKGRYLMVVPTHRGIVKIIMIKNKVRKATKLP